jgi:ParB-like chromosome segregation protein Spo0J
MKKRRPGRDPGPPQPEPDEDCYMATTTTKTEKVSILGIPADPFTTPVHPAAELFPLMPEDELRDLAEDIKKNGLRFPIIMQDGKVLDGRNRLRACKLAGVNPNFQWRPKGASDDDALTFVVSTNLHRRHLTPAQRREVVAALLKQDPKRSNRQVAEQAKADHKTVGAVREKLEATGEIPQLKETTGKDGKARPTSAPKKTETSTSRAAKPKDEGIDLSIYFSRCTGTIEGTRAALEKHIDEDAWALFIKQSPATYERLFAACASMAALLNKVQSPALAYNRPKNLKSAIALLHWIEMESRKNEAAVCLVDIRRKASFVREFLEDKEIK